jgi:hypothetical protein
METKNLPERDRSMRFLPPIFFHESTTYGSLIHTLKVFPCDKDRDMIRTGSRTEPETCTRQGLRQGLGRNRDGNGHRQGQGRDRDMDTDSNRKGIGTWTRTGTRTGMGTWTGT